MLREFLNPIIVPMLAEIGYDFLIIDCEHGTANFEDIKNLVIVAKKYELAILVRPKSTVSEKIPKYLDLGINGIMVPHVETKNEILNLIEKSKFKPIGSRSYGISKILFKMEKSDKNESDKNDLPKKSSNNTSKENLIKYLNENQIIILQIESTKGINMIINLEPDIMTKIDGIIVGPADLTLDLGIIGQYENQIFEEKTLKLLNFCKKNQISFGIHFSDISLVQKWRKKGMNILLYNSIYGILDNSLRNLFKKLSSI
ncbi:MAG: aldolase/citrate lyase family protein [Promethearchaeota archaeon]